MVRKKKNNIRPLALFSPKKKLNTFIFLGVICVTLTLSITSLSIIHADKSLQKRVLGTSGTQPKVIKTNKKTGAQIRSLISKPSATPANNPSPTLKPKPTHLVISSQSTPTPINNPTPTPVPNKLYTAEKVGDTTYKINHTSSDGEMSTAWQIYDALNSYRNTNGKSSLTWDNGLASLAEDRAKTFNNDNGLDSHTGFRSFMENDGFSKAGFNGLGENSAQLAGNMAASRIINEIFGADADHDGNQLDPAWTHIGVGVNGLYVNVNFGKGKR